VNESGANFADNILDAACCGLCAKKYCIPHYIGDAGEYSKRQNGVILDAAGKILKGKTPVFYLGDNVHRMDFILT